MPTPDDGTTYIFEAYDPPSAVTSIEIDGVEVLDDPVDGRSSNSDLADDIVASINAATSDPDYTAVAIGRRVAIAAGRKAKSRTGERCP